MTTDFSVSCPKCKREAHRQPEGVLSYFDPNFTCKFCPYRGSVQAAAHNRANAKRRTTKATAARLAKRQERLARQAGWTAINA
jgi:hypothetical protein